jgi:hypothetical protein
LDDESDSEPVDDGVDDDQNSRKVEHEIRLNDLSNDGVQKSIESSQSDFSGSSMMVFNDNLQSDHLTDNSFTQPSNCHSAGEEEDDNRERTKLEYYLSTSDTPEIPMQTTKEEEVATSTSYGQTGEGQVGSATNTRDGSILSIDDVFVEEGESSQEEFLLYEGNTASSQCKEEQQGHISESELMEEIPGGH